jgi:cytoskeleton protein RodZ
MATSIGEQLRLSREERGIALRDISEQTRISVNYLEAIERSDYKRLPGGIFNRSFIKAYARCIGFDEKEAIEAYADYMREQGHPIDEEIVTPYHSRVYTDAPATRSPVLTVFLAILILAILTIGTLALLRWYQRRSRPAAVARSSSFAVALLNTELKAESGVAASAGRPYERVLA